MTPDSREPWSGPVDVIRAAAIARLYYLGGRSKSDIAGEFGLSRFKVARILDDAVATGIVKIQIELPGEFDARLSDELRVTLGLRHAIVVEIPENDDAARRVRLGRAAADLLDEVLLPGETLGIAWGRTLSAMTSQLTRLAPCTVVQLAGVISASDNMESGVELVRRVAAISGGQARRIYAPLLVSDSSTAEMLRRQPQVADTLRRHDQLTTAVIAIGSWKPPDSTVYDVLTNADRHALQDAGVEAELSAIFLGKDGQILDTDLNRRLIAITGEQLKNVPQVIAVAGGPSKHKAIQATLRAGFVNSLVTDSETARFLLAEAHRLDDAAPPRKNPIREGEGLR